MEEKTYGRIGETLYCGTLTNGLPVYVDVKPGFEKQFAFFATNYGGMDTRFQLDGVWQDTPDGVAHFLEHKLFDTEDGNALQDMAAAGASPNAFTSSAITGYYFECTEKFRENLKTLLSFVSIPYFTPESVQKEQGIIAQEIRMGDDDPEQQVFLNLMDGLFQNHPVKKHVAGSVESISHITDKTLYACHKAFYHPGNMVLCVAGDVDPAGVLALAEEILHQTAGENPPRDYGDAEPQTVAQSEITVSMEVSKPLFQVGFKAENVPNGPEKLRVQLLAELTGEALFGSSSPLYAKLYGEGLIDGQFSYGYESYPGCALLCAGGESRDPQAVRDAILAEAVRIGTAGIEASLWQRLKKAAYGNRVRGLNSFENVCIELAQGHFAGAEYLSFPEAFDAISKEDAEDCIRRWIVPARTSLSVIKPKEDAKA
ncbi:MAG: pitrilysin family protein [Oscillospiraceae bacterium]